MNGAHDLGGRHGFGAIDRSQQENFAHDWERRVFRMTLGCGMLGNWNLDESRFAREDTDPAHYLASSYYEHWLDGLEKLLLEKGMISAEELASGVAQGQGAQQAVGAEAVAKILAGGGPTEMPCDRAAQFSAGDVVIVKADAPRGHTRAPEYVRGKRGTIIGHYGAHIYADEHARSGEKVPEYLYSVEFSGDALWGQGHGDTASAVRLDLFEPYLLSVQAHIAGLQGAG